MPQKGNPGEGLGHMNGASNVDEIPIFQGANNVGELASAGDFVDPPQVGEIVATAA